MSRFPVFLTGILVGAGVSAAAVYMVYNGQTTKSNAHPKTANQNRSQSTPTNTVKPEENNSDPDTGKLIHLQSVEIHRSEPNDDYYPNIDENSPLYDSLIAQNQEVKSDFELNGNQVVKREKLISVKTIEIVSRNPEKTAGNKTDSLLKSKNNIRETVPGSSYEVEFWQSPLNSRGYRMGRSKLALYGIDPNAPIKLFRLEEGLFLRNEKNLFRLESSSEFKSLKAVSDPELIRQTE